MTPPHQRARRGAGLVGLLAAVGLLVTLKEASDPSAQSHLALPTAGGQLGSTAVSTPTTTVPSASSPSSSAPSSSTPSSGAAPATTGSGPRQVAGAVEQTAYGPIQVRVTLDGTRITNVTALQSPSDQGRSVDIAQQALPQLRQEVLTAQSARIDTVSGASYDSMGYALSVQSALDQARA